MKIKILHISPNFNYSCGVSKHIFLLFKHFYSSDLVELHFITNGGDSLKRLDKLKIPYKVVKFSTGIKNILFVIPAFIKIIKYCNLNQIDIIHTHHRFPELLSCFISKITNVKTVTTVHSYVDNYKFASFKSDKIIVVSHFIKKAILRHFNINEKKITVLYNFVEMMKPFNVERIKQLREKYNLTSNDFILLFIGRISKIKGVDILISTFDLLKREHENLKLLLVGEIQDDFKKSENIKNEQSIIIIQPQNDIENFYKLADIILLPSRMDPFPFTMLEAALTEKPIIASNVGGIPEFIEHNKNGLLFNMENFEELYLTIKKMIINSELRERLVTNNKKVIKKYLDSDNYFNNLWNIYREVLK